MKNHLIAARLTISTLLGIAATLPAQKLEKWQKDPFTKNDPEKMAAAGYLNYGPFAFGNLASDTVTSTQIQASLPFTNIIWMETEHFRIGVELPTWSVPTAAPIGKKIRAELTELKKKLPSIDPKTRKLTPWLRAHLTAYRLEKLHAETQALFGVSDDQFPSDPSKVFAEPGKTYMGYGPHMGMRGKFLLLVIAKQGPFRQYMEKYLGRPSVQPQRWHFVESSSLIYTCTLESDRYPLKHDTALHCALAFNVSQNLLDGFRSYAYDLPVWIREGFAHWNGRRIDGKWPNFDQNEGSLADMKTTSKWKPYAKSLIGKTKKYAPFPTVAKWRDFGDITFNDHVMIFSRMDYLMSMGQKKWQTFLFTVKGRVDAEWNIDQTDLVDATREGLKKAYNLTFLNFDDKWRAWVKETYPSR